MFEITHRKKPCDVCESDLIDITHTSQTFVDGAVDEIYEERCIQCKNLLYGWVKRVKKSEVAILKDVRYNQM